MADPVKVMVIGPVLGQIRAFCDKVTTLDAKYGPFGFILCVGDFFNEEGQDQSDVDELFNGSIQVPKTTYIMGGAIKIPTKVQEKADHTGGELAPNLLLLGKASVITTSQGIRIAALGGVYDPASYSSPKYAPSNHFTSYDVRKLLAHPSIKGDAVKHHQPNSLAAFKAASEASPMKIDILITHVVPDSLVLHTPGVPESLRDLIAPPLDDVVKGAMPRYHIISGASNFWERDPFGWPGVAEDGRCTRFISIGSFGGTVLEGQKKPRWSYAFSIVPLTPSSPPLPMPANISPNPFMPHQAVHLPLTSTSPKGQKRPLVEESGEQFRWTHDGRDKIKRRKIDAAQDGPPAGYTCRICGSTEHRIQDCPQKSKPPEGYICRRCQQTDHFIRDCPTKDEKGDTGGRKPPSGYVCRACGSEAHLIEDCPVVVQTRHGREQKGTRGPQKEISAQECWFCLSNPNLAKHLLVSLGEECYLSLPKGQLPISSSDDPKMKEMFPVPGGGQVLIIPISHYPTLRSLPPEEADSTLSEVEKYKSALRSFYASYSCTPLFFEIAKRMVHGVHAQLHVVPIPRSIPEQEVEETFQQVAKQMQISFSEGKEALGDAADNYFMVELSGGNSLVSIIEDGSRFPLQFARMALASIFGLPDRVDWKNCVESEQTEKQEAEDFKAAFKSFDPFA